MNQHLLSFLGDPLLSITAIAINLVVSIPVSSEINPQQYKNSSLIQSTPSSRAIESNDNCASNITALTNQLLRDLPDYSNRVIQRTQERHQEAGIYTYIVLAGQPEFEPLDLPQINYHQANTNNTKQIFFTTLERQYNKNQKIERETYHWLFVTMAEDGWHLFTIFSRFGNATKNTPPNPPQESSQGIIGQAVNLWLRDCRANALHN